MKREGITLDVVETNPLISWKDVVSGDLEARIYDLNWERLMALGHAGRSSSKPFALGYLPLHHILARAAAQIRALPLLPYNRDHQFRRLARAWCVFGAFNPILGLITKSQLRGGRDPGGWGKESDHLKVFQTLDMLQRKRPGITQPDIAKALNRKGFTTIHGEKFNRNSVRTLLESPGYEAFCKPIHIPKNLRPRFRIKLPNGLYPPQQKASDALRRGEDVLLPSGTGSGKQRVAMEHHKHRIASDPEHLTVVVEPHKSVIWEMVSRYGGVALCGNLDSKANREVLAKLEAGTEGGLVFLTPDKLMTEREGKRVVLEAIQKRESVFLVVDEGDCVLEDAEYRKAYRDFKDCVIAIRPDQVLLMTATAAKGFVRQYLHDQVLPNGRPWTEVNGNLDRPNLFYQSHRLKNQTARRVYTARVVRAHIKLRHRGIVYMDSISRANRMQAYPKKHLGCNVGLYHSKQSDAENQDVLEGYRSGQINVVVATSGFGRGLDLNVDFVVVAHTPDNISTLIQFFGRAGRKGLPAYCWWLVCDADHFFLEHVRKGLGNSPLLKPAKEYLEKQTHQIEGLSKSAGQICLRVQLLKSQGNYKPAKIAPSRCCLVCAQDSGNKKSA